MQQFSKTSYEYFIFDNIFYYSICEHSVMSKIVYNENCLFFQKIIRYRCATFFYLNKQIKRGVCKI